MSRPYAITLNCSALSRAVLVSLADAAWASVSVGRPALKTRYSIEVWNSPRAHFHGYLLPDKKLIRAFLPCSYAAARAHNQIAPRDYPGLVGGPQYWLNDLEECCFYLFAHELRHMWDDAMHLEGETQAESDERELICELAAESALNDFRRLRTYWLPA